MDGEFVRPDELFRVSGEGPQGLTEWMVSAKYDRADYVPRLGHWMLKIWDDSDGLATLHVDEPTALKVIAYAELPVCNRTFLYQSEYEGYLQAVAKMMEGWTE